MKVRVYNLQGINEFISPFQTQDGQMLSMINMDMYPYGAFRKRPGYTTYLNNPDGSVVNNLFDWHRNDGSTFWNYRSSGTSLWYSTQGTGDWTPCGNGTIASKAYVGHAVLEDTMLICDGVNPTRHSTNGTSFTNTTAAPVSVDLQDFQQRIYAAGTGSDVFYSSTGTATDWTTDSSSIAMPGPGKLVSILKSSDRLVATKNSGNIYRYDGYSLVDMATDLGPTSVRAIGNVEGYRIWPNRLGYFGFGGDKPEILSNPIQNQIYNNSGSSLAGTTFDIMGGAIHQYDYLGCVGTMTEDITGLTIPNCVQLYDFQLNDWRNYSLGVNPSAVWSFKNNDLQQQLIFGAVDGQVYTLGGTVLSDNGQPIHCSCFGVTALTMPETEKKYNYLWVHCNPGCEGNLQIAITDTFNKENLNWQTVGDLRNGFVEYRFPPESRGRLLFYKFSESSTNATAVIYGISVDFDPIERH